MNERARGPVDADPERLIDPETLATIERELAKLLIHGFGELLIVVDHSQIRELRPTPKIRL